jgi:hypothetical protein
MNLNELWEDIDKTIASDGLSLSSVKLLSTGASTIEGDILIGVDSRGLRHLVVPAPEEASEQRDDSSRGILVEVRPYIYAGRERLYCDVSCRLTDLNDIFSEVVDDMISELIRESEDSSYTVCIRVLERWRQLIERVPSETLSLQKQAGLLSELLILRDLAEFSPAALESWAGPEGGRHDFISSEADIEVKSSTRPDSLRAHVQSLDQLDQGKAAALYLHFVSFRAPTGQGLTIPDLVAELKDLGINSTDLYQKLSKVGYSPADQKVYSRSRFEIIQRVTFRVDQPGFPRLVPDSISGDLPVGVENIGYDVDLATADSFRLPQNEFDKILEVTASL